MFCFVFLFFIRVLLCFGCALVLKAPLKLGSHCGDDRYRPYFIVDDEFCGMLKFVAHLKKLGDERKKDGR